MAPSDNARRSAVVTTPDEAGIARRGFFKLVSGLLTVGIGAVIGVPALAYVLAPLRSKARTAPLIPLGNTSSLALGGPQRVEVVADREDAWTKEEGVRLGSVWLVRASGEALACYSTVCPHLGCAIDFDSQKKQFACPCHSSVFSLDGKVVSGPSPRPMDALELTTQNGQVSVQYRRFRQGTPRQEPI